LSSSSSLLLLAKTITHPAARSLCDSWASCFVLTDTQTVFSGTCPYMSAADTCFVSNSACGWRSGQEIIIEIFALVLTARAYVLLFLPSCILVGFRWRCACWDRNIEPRWSCTGQVVCSHWLAADSTLRAPTATPPRPWPTSPAPDHQPDPRRRSAESTLPPSPRVQRSNPVVQHSLQGQLRPSLSSSSALHAVEVERVERKIAVDNSRRLVNCARNREFIYCSYRCGPTI